MIDRTTVRHLPPTHEHTHTHTHTQSQHTNKHSIVRMLSTEKQTQHTKTNNDTHKRATTVE